MKAKIYGNIFRGCEARNTLQSTFQLLPANRSIKSRGERLGEGSRRESVDFRLREIDGLFVVADKKKRETYVI